MFFSDFPLHTDHIGVPHLWNPPSLKGTILWMKHGDLPRDFYGFFHQQNGVFFYWM